MRKNKLFIITVIAAMSVSGIALAKPKVKGDVAVGKNVVVGDASPVTGEEKNTSTVSVEGGIDVTNSTRSALYNFNAKVRGDIGTNETQDGSGYDLKLGGFIGSPIQRRSSDCDFIYAGTATGEVSQHKNTTQFDTIFATIGGTMGLLCGSKNYGLFVGPTADYVLGDIGTGDFLSGPQAGFKFELDSKYFNLNADADYMAIFGTENQGSKFRLQADASGKIPLGKTMNLSFGPYVSYDRIENKHISQGFNDDGVYEVTTTDDPAKGVLQAGGQIKVSF